MASDNYGSAHWATDKDLKAEGIERIPAVEIARNHSGGRSFLLGCAADSAELTKTVRQGYSEVLGAIADGAESLVRKVAGEHHGRELLGWTGDGHILTVAPTRSGKGVGLVIPNLLHYRCWLLIPKVRTMPSRIGIVNGHSGTRLSALTRFMSLRTNLRRRTASIRLTDWWITSSRSQRI